MDNNNYNNSFNNNTGNGAPDNGAGQDSTYSYSYVGQEQKNPNNVWRAEENTSGQSNAGQSSAGQNASGQYSQAYSGYGGAYNQYGSIYDKPHKEKKKRHFNVNVSSGSFGVKLAKCASIALVFGLVAGTAFEGSSYLLGNALGTNEQRNVADDTQTNVLSTTDSADNGVVTTAASDKTDIAAITEKCMPSIVAITNMSEVQYQNWFGQVQNYESQSAGSGIIVSEDDEYLYIATNNHVVESAKTLTIQFSDETTATAEVRGTEKSADLAVVKVKKSDIEPDTLKTIKVATLGSSDKLQVGAEAIAIGNALGYGQSVTTGVVSAIEREVTIQDETTGESFTNDLIQTDAAINPGNSGGALLNSNGEVIGINSSKYSDTTVEGMGFAIPIDMAKPIIEDLITREAVSEEKAAFLGINGVDVTADVSESYNMPKGVCIMKVTQGSAAQKAGLQKGDIITAFDGKTVNSMESLQSMLRYYTAGTTVDVTVQRTAEGGYKEQTISVTLGKKNS